VHKVIDGKKIECSQEEENRILQEWEDNKEEKQLARIAELKALEEKLQAENQKLRDEVLKMKEEGLI